MPYYDFLNEETGEVKSLFFHMNEIKEYIDENSYKWKRLFNIPQASFNTKWDALNPQDFVRKTALKRGTYGDITDKSAELSLKRQELTGRDKIKENYISNWQNKRKKQHPETRQKQLKEGLAKKGVDIET